MEVQVDWLFEGTTLDSILRRRPLSMAFFEASGIDPWKHLDKGLGEILGAHGLDVEDSILALRSLPIPAPECDWKSLPIYHLLDFLASEHRYFLRDALPTISRVLSDDMFSDVDSLQYLDRMSTEWPAFAASLVAHLHEEEDVLFQRLLRYHTSLYQGGDPDLEGGSVRVFGTVRMLTHGHRDLELTRLFLEKVLPTLPGGRSSPSALEERLRPLLDALHQKLTAHAQLESQVLFPMAIAMEKTLYDRLIQGGGARSAASLASTRIIRGSLSDSASPLT